MSFEFASLIGSLISLPIVMLAAKKGFLVPKKVWSFRDNDEVKIDEKTIDAASVEDHGISIVKAWLPYVIIAIILMITRIDALGLKAILQKSIFVIKFDSLFGIPELTYNFKWAYLPGTIFLIVAFITDFDEHG